MYTLYYLKNPIMFGLRSWYIHTVFDKKKGHEPLIQRSMSLRFNKKETASMLSPPPHQHLTYFRLNPIRPFSTCF